MLVSVRVDSSGWGAESGKGWSAILLQVNDWETEIKSSGHKFLFTFLSSTFQLLMQYFMLGRGDRCSSVVSHASSSHILFVCIHVACRYSAKCYCVCWGTSQSQGHGMLRSKFKKNLKFHLVKNLNINSTMWKYCWRGFIWMVTS